MPEITIRPPKLRFQPLTSLEKEQVRNLSRDGRITAMCEGRLTYGQLFWWASNWPEEVPLINNEFAFVALFEPGAADISIPAATTIAALAA